MRAAEAAFISLSKQLSADEVQVNYFWLNWMTLNLLFSFNFLAINNQSQNFAVECSFLLSSDDFVVVQNETASDLHRTGLQELVQHDIGGAMPFPRSLRTSAWNEKDIVISLLI